MKKVFIVVIYIVTASLLIQQVADQNLISKAFANSEEAVLKQLSALLSEDYCPNNGAGNWDWNIEKAAPECLLEQAKKIRLAVFGPSEFSDEEEQKLRKLVASAKEAQAKLKEVGCKPGVVKKWTDNGQVDAPPECMQTEARIAQEHNRKNGMGGGKTFIQVYVLDTKLRHLEDMDQLNYLLAQVLYQYSCDTDMQTREECVSNFYNSIKSKW